MTATEHRPVGARLLAAGLVVASLVAAAPVLGLEPALVRAETLKVFDAIAAKAEGSGLTVSVNGGARVPIRIGEDIVYAFESTTDAYLTALHVDSHGLTTLIYPGPDVEVGRIRAGRTQTFPPEGASYGAVAEPPVGIETLFVVASQTPIPRAELVRSGGSDPVLVIDPEAGTALAKRLAALLAARPANSYAVASLQQEIQGRGETQYRSADIEDYFAGSRTRSIRQPSLDLHIGFATDSADLDATARRDLDEVVRAFASPRLVTMQFAVRGHTDDRGPDDYNVELSRRRAQAVEDYLVEKGIEPSRLSVEAHGERVPLEPGTSERARRLNRRVDFQLMRSTADDGTN